jgi:predicted signal transduction protein with EAL and GGDEF domain
MGVALLPDHARDSTGLLKRADVAMYVAKSTDMDICVYEAKDDRRSPQRLALVGDLRQALVRGELAVHFQPKVVLADASLEGVEALARWWHPTLGDVPPDEFVPVAERSGHIAELTLQVLDRTLAAATSWAASGPGAHDAVNLSPRSLLDPGLVSSVQDRLDHYGVPADRLTLEITESSVMADSSRTIATLHALRDLGVRLSVDDFGTGYSSLSYLKRLPVDEVKIDKSFVSTMEHRHGQQLYRPLDHRAGHQPRHARRREGVETPAVWERLRELGCDVAQGYLMGKTDAVRGDDPVGRSGMPGIRWSRRERRDGS